MNLAQLTTWKGEINRRDYLIWGVILFAVKYNLDRLTAMAFDRTWYITDYFVQADRLAVQHLSETDKTFYLILVLQSFPFVLAGTLLCLKRLRNARLPLWTVVFFFIPFINFLLFLILAAVPERHERGKSQKTSLLSKVIPASKYGSAIFSVGIVLVISLLIMGLLLNYLNDYGWSLFVGIPFFLGFGSVLIYGYHKRLKYKEALGVTFISIVFFNLIIFILAFEGIICITMAFPILMAIGWIGASIGYAIHDNQNDSVLSCVVIPMIFLPVLGWVEHTDNETPPTVWVSTEVIIDAPDQAIWNELVAFSRIDEPVEFLFQTGIAYPTHAEIQGSGVGAIRKCNFTTGAFIEPITTWDEPRLLEFGVLDQPPPMLEWSIYNDLEIAHLDGYFKSVKGQFKLEPMGDGRTRLVGTTWYTHKIWPSVYWKLWSDFILHRIHLRVLNHIKLKVED